MKRKEQESKHLRITNRRTSRSGSTAKRKGHPATGWPFLFKGE